MTRIRVRVLPALIPIDGKQVEMQVSATHIQWRYVTDVTGEYEWEDLIAIADLIGADGPAVEMRSDGTNIQYRVVGDVTWIDVVPLADLTGPQGATGLQGDQGDPGPQGDPGVVQAVVAGDGIDVDATDPANPIVSFEKEISTDGTLAGNSDDAVPTEKAVKTYVDANGVADGNKTDVIVSSSGTVWTLDSSFAGTKTFEDGVIATGAATGAIGHADSQLESRNDGGGHALVSIVNTVNPGSTVEEAGVTLVAYDDAGVIKQMASISGMWGNNASVATGYGILRFNAATPAAGSDIAQRISSGKGVTFYGTSETDFPGVKQVKFRRNGVGIAHIVGDGDLILDGAASGGAASTVFLNGQNAGDVQIAFGGGTAIVNSGTGANAAAASLKVGSKSGRSINAGGTINASGADYAEYMRKADGCGEIAKGDIVGIDANGDLTDKWDRSIHFMVKSTNPSLVGGDDWGDDEAIGSEPQPKPELCLAPFDQAEPSPSPRTKGKRVDAAARKAEHGLAMLRYRAAKASHEAAIEQATRVYEEVTLPAWQAACAEHAAMVEAARQHVDRIAFSGQVPVNLTGATPGDYIIAVQDGDGIGAKAVSASAITFAQSLITVGKVIAIESDGRARIVVRAA